MRILISRAAVASAALLTAAGIGIAAGWASPALADSASGGTAISAAAPATCDEVSTGSGAQAFNKNDAYSWVEWTANSCGWLLEERSFCKSTIDGSTLWSTSGVVKAVGLMDTSYCPADYRITRGEKRTSSDGGSTWTTYVTFWTPPS